MNTKNNAKVVLCYGDSNVYGQRSDDVSKGRWPANVRWTGQLQNLLGDEYYVIEEGLGGRTTDLGRAEPDNGRDYLAPCLTSHNPIDTIVLMLGTNDCKLMFNRSPLEIAGAIEGIIDDIVKYAKASVILVSPISIDNQASQFAALYSHDFNYESGQKVAELAGLFKSIAARRGLSFLDAATVARPGEDGVHFSKESHATFAKSLAPLVTSSVR